MMEPTKHCDGREDEHNWTEMLESLRKDVECLFGELKQEFAILKYGSRFNDLTLMDSIFLTCCAIHNQRKTLAGMDEMDIIIKAVDDDLSQVPASVFRRLEEYQRLQAIPEDDASAMGGGENLILPFDDNVVEEHDVSHDIVKKCLHSKLENNAIQLLKCKKRIYAVGDMIENNDVFITLSDIQLTMTEFKVRYEALRDNRNDETHPFGKNDYKPEDLLHKSIDLIKKMDFATVDTNSHVYFAKLVIENYSAVLQINTKINNHHLIITTPTIA